MSKIRVLEKLDGSVGIIYPAPKSRRLDETEEDWLERVFTKCNPQGLDFEDIDTSDLPSDREDRGAWKLDRNSKKVKVDSVKKQQLDDAKQAKKDLKDSAENKLKTGQPLTDEDLKALGLKS